MISKMKRTGALILALVWMISPLAWAQEQTVGDYTYGISTKFGRGLWNVISSPAEIPCTMKVRTEADGAATGLTAGFGEGILLMLRRIIVGVTEVGTFIIPMERTIPPVCHEEI